MPATTDELAPSSRQRRSPATGFGQSCALAAPQLKTSHFARVPLAPLIDPSMSQSVHERNRSKDQQPRRVPLRSQPAGQS